MDDVKSIVNVWVNLMRAEFQLVKLLKKISREKVVKELRILGYSEDDIEAALVYYDKVKA